MIDFKDILLSMEPPFARTARYWIENKAFLAKLAWQRATEEFSDDQLWDYRLAMLRHLRAAIVYSSNPVRLVPNDYDTGQPQHERAFGADMDKVVADIDFVISCHEWEELVLGPDGDLEIKHYTNLCEREKNAWERIMEFVRRDASNLGY